MLDAVIQLSVCVRFAQHEHINKMTPNNLAIIFAPCLLQGPTEKSPDEILKDLEKQTL